MSYDVVALVARASDDRAIVNALRDVDPELWLHWHGDTNLLQIRDEDGPLPATIEPGQRVEHPDDVARLLGPEVMAGLPETFWWLEVRSRPDERGREVAHRFADGLALRLGGAAATHAGEKMLQVLTSPTARLTYGARTFLAGPLGRWVVQGEDGGHFDGLTGLAVHWDETYGFLPEREPTGVNRAAGQPDIEPVPGFLTGLDEITGTQLVVEVSVQHRDPFTPRLGRAAQIVVEHLAGAAPTAWGPHEPALRAWDREQMVAFPHRRTPKPSLLYLSGPWGQGHPFSG